MMPDGPLLPESLAAPTPTCAYVPVWRAELNLGFSHRRNKTVLHHRAHQGPLSVQRTFYPENDGCAHVYLLHPPAGIVSGDELHITAHLQSASQVLLTTPGANRFYRARSTAEDQTDSPASRQTQRCQLSVEDGASLEYLPLETLVFAGANALNQLEIKLQGNATYMGWEVLCLGLPHIGQPFEQGRIRQTTTLYHDGVPLFHDRLCLQALDELHQQKIALGGRHVVGNFIIFSARIAAEPQQLAELIASLRGCLSSKQQAHYAITAIQGVVVIRHLGDDSEACRQTFMTLWACARQIVLHKTSRVPRIWYT